MILATGMIMTKPMLPADIETIDQAFEHYLTSIGRPADPALVAAMRAAYAAGMAYLFAQVAAIADSEDETSIDAAEARLDALAEGLRRMAAELFPAKPQASNDQASNHGEGS
jgi:hypothetical protein